MTNPIIERSDFRLLIPEEVFLEEEDYSLAKQLSEIHGTEQQKWDVYINLLSMLAMEKWLTDNINDQDIKRITDTIDTYAYLEQKGFKFCLITQQDFLQEGMMVPELLIKNPSHFYLAVEVDEENAVVIIRGFISYDQLSQLSLPTVEKNTYWLSLDYLEPELNHLLLTCKHQLPSSFRQ